MITCLQELGDESRLVYLAGLDNSCRCLREHAFYVVNIAAADTCIYTFEHIVDGTKLIVINAKPMHDRWRYSCDGECKSQLLLCGSM